MRAVAALTGALGRALARWRGAGVEGGAGRVCGLRTLALDCNGLAALPACVCELPALERLTIDDNSLRWVARRVARR